MKLVQWLLDSFGTWHLVIAIAFAAAAVVTLVLGYRSHELAQDTESPAALGWWKQHEGRILDDYLTAFDAVIGKEIKGKITLRIWRKDGTQIIGKVDASGRGPDGTMFTFVERDRLSYAKSDEIDRVEVLRVASAN